MKKIVLSIVALELVIGGAFAADLPSRKAPILPPPPPPPMWAGFYAGLNAGYTWAGSNSFTTGNWIVDDRALNGGLAAGLGGNNLKVANDGFVGGGQIGYNWQGNFAGFGYVAGIEADMQGSAARGAGWGGSAAPWIGGVAAGGPHVDFPEQLACYKNDGQSGIMFDKPQGANCDASQNWDAFSFVTMAFPQTNANAAGSATISTSVSKSLDWVGTVRGRLGFLATPSLLIYATGGLAYGQVSAAATTSVNGSSSGRTVTDYTNYFMCIGVDDSVCEAGAAAGVYTPEPTPPSINTPFSYSVVAFGGSRRQNTQVGYSVGGGVEWMITPNISLKGEYLYYDLGKTTFTSAIVATNTATGASGVAAITRASTHFDGRIARAGVNYHFNWGGATPVANY